MTAYTGHCAIEGNMAREVVQWWREAEAASRSKQLPRARRFLRWILACCPDDEEAWLWLARLASNQEARMAYLRQAYAFNRDSARVQSALRQARSQQLEAAVGDLKPGHSPLRCLPDERYLCHGDTPCQRAASQIRSHSKNGSARSSGP